MMSFGAQSQNKMFKFVHFIAAHWLFYKTCDVVFTLRHFQPRLRRQHLKLLDGTTGYLSSVFVTTGCFWQDAGTFSSCEKSLDLTTTLDVFKEARRHLQPCLWSQNQIFFHEMSCHWFSLTFNFSSLVSSQVLKENKGFILSLQFSSLVSWTPLNVNLQLLFCAKKQSYIHDCICRHVHARPHD